MGTMKTSRFAVQGGGDRRRRKGPEKEARGGTQAVPPRAWRNRFSGSCGGASSGADVIFLDAIFRGKVVPKEIVETSRSVPQGGVKRRRKNVAEK